MTALHVLFTLKAYFIPVSKVGLISQLEIEFVFCFLIENTLSIIYKALDWIRNLSAYWEQFLVPQLVRAINWLSR